MEREGEGMERGLKGKNGKGRKANGRDRFQKNMEGNDNEENWG